MEIPGPHVTEAYKCSNCNLVFRIGDVNRTWTCPTCTLPIGIKVVIGDFEHLGFRLKPSQLRVDKLVTLDRVNTHLILSIERKEGDYLIALQNYRRKTFNEDDYLLVIEGSWTN